MKNFTTDSYCALLDCANWDSVFQSTDPNESWLNFRTILTDIIDKIAPIKHIRIKQQTEPWMTSDILDKIATRDELLNSYKRNTNNKDLYKQFCKIRNNVQREIKEA